MLLKHFRGVSNEDQKDKLILRGNIIPQGGPEGQQCFAGRFLLHSIPGLPLMNIHMTAAALYPMLCNYHFKGSQMLIRLEHGLKKG